MSEEATFLLRHDTQDQQVFDDVLVNNQYRLPDSLPPDSLVIDIGANIGAFAAACLLRGAGTVVCFEPSEHNFRQLVANMEAWPGQAPCFNAAVWRSDRSEKLNFIGGNDRHTACGGCMPASCAPPAGASSSPVAAMGLDEILFYATDGGKRRVNLLKIDAEGSEYPILYTSKHLHIVDQIVGETHQYPAVWPGDKFFVADFPSDQACATGMKSFLELQDFTVTQERESAENDICTLFFAKRTSTPETP